MPSNNSREILVIAPAWVGDFIMAQSLFQILATRAAVIDLLAPAWTISLATRMPEVRTALTFPLGHGQLGLATRWRIARQLRSYDQAIVLPSSIKAALIPWLARIPRRTGYLGEQRWGLLNDIRPQRSEQTVARFAALGIEPNEAPAALPLPRLVPDRQNAQTTITRLGIPPPNAPIVALCPGAEYGAAKRWPGEHFAQVACAASAAGWEVWLFGAASDAPLTGEIQRRSNNARDLAGRTTLPEAVDLLAFADAVVSNDSGLMHIAAALDRPLIALFGSSDPRRTPPLSKRATILRRDLPCSPCFRRTCPHGHLRCLREITPDEVCAALFNFPNISR